MVEFIKTEDFKHLINIKSFVANKEIVNTYLKYYENFSDITSKSTDFLLYKYHIYSIK